MGASLTFAFDGNFRFDLEDLVWREFFDKHGISPVRYDDMAKLTEALNDSVQTIAYLPAANYFYIRNNPAYEPVASAIYAAEGTTRLASLLVVSASSDVIDVEQLRGARLGYVHPYCTTSYFAPALLSHEHGHSIADFFELVAVAAYEPQVDAVIEGRVDATMVQEDVWRKHPNYGEQTRVIGREDDLPTPVVLVDVNAGAELKDDLNRILLTYQPPIGPDTLFAGFVPFEREQVERFFEAGAVAIPPLPTAAAEPA